MCLRLRKWDCCKMVSSTKAILILSPGFHLRLIPDCRFHWAAGSSTQQDVAHVVGLEKIVFAWCFGKDWQHTGRTRDLNSATVSQILPFRYICINWNHKENVQLLWGLMTFTEQQVLQPGNLRSVHPKSFEHSARTLFTLHLRRQVHCHQGPQKNGRDVSAKTKLLHSKGRPLIKKDEKC